MNNPTYNHPINDFTPVTLHILSARTRYMDPTRPGSPAASLNHKMYLLVCVSHDKLLMRALFRSRYVFSWELPSFVSCNIIVSVFLLPLVVGADFRRGQQWCGTKLLVEPAVFRVSGGNNQDGRLQESRRVSTINLFFVVAVLYRNCRHQPLARDALTT